MVFEYFFIDHLFSVIAAAIQGDVDCVDYLSHLVTPLPLMYECLEGLAHRIVHLIVVKDVPPPSSPYLISPVRPASTAVLGPA